MGGVAPGVLVPWVAIRLERTRFFSATTFYEPLNAFAVGLLVLALAMLTHANVFLAAFSAGITIATMSPELRTAFYQFGELVAELLKLAALLVFAALISLQFLGDIGVSGYLFAALALFAARPTALGIALLRSKLDRKERVAAAWAGIPLSDEPSTWSRSSSPRRSWRTPPLMYSSLAGSSPNLARMTRVTTRSADRSLRRAEG